MFTNSTRQATHLIIVRHGHPDESQTAVNGGDCHKNHDPELSIKGQAQAQRVAERLAAEGVDAIVSSPLKRAFQTASALSSLINMKIDAVPGLAEVDGGRGTYETPEAIRARNDGSWEAFLADPVGYFGGDAATFRANVLGAFDTLLQREDARRIAVFTHGTPINALLGSCLGFPELTRIGPTYCSITRVAGYALDRVHVLSVNESGHFAPGELR
jgi:broad specificity phosphatase PhoE